MSRFCTLATLTLTAAALLVGCASKDVPYNQQVQVQLEEISGEHPVKIVLKVDGKVRFDGELMANRKVPIPIHAADQDGRYQLPPGKHTISWVIHKNHPMGKVGDGRVTVYAGNQQLMTSNSKWIMPLFKWWWSLDVNLQGPGGPGTDVPPGFGPTPSGPDNTGPADNTNGSSMEMDDDRETPVIGK
jgi:hypothetical protein